jgi:hypothetical protein
MPDSNHSIAYRPSMLLQLLFFEFSSPDKLGLWNESSCQCRQVFRVGFSVGPAVSQIRIRVGQARQNCTAVFAVPRLGCLRINPASFTSYAGLSEWKQALSYSKAKATVRNGYWRSSCVRAKMEFPDSNDSSRKPDAIEVVKKRQIKPCDCIAVLAEKSELEVPQ